MYADMFVTLWDHPEWQKDFGLNPAPSDSLVLPPEEENQGERVKHCSSSSRGQICYKHLPEKEDDLGLRVSNCSLDGGTDDQAADADTLMDLEQKEADLAHLEEKIERIGRMSRGEDKGDMEDVSRRRGEHKGDREEVSMDRGEDREDKRGCVKGQRF